jgi:hypothetical protein
MGTRATIVAEETRAVNSLMSPTRLKLRDLGLSVPHPVEAEEDDPG